MSDTVTMAREVLSACRAARLTLATAESCTGGLIIGALTEIAGSSDVVDRGFITYSNAAKSDMLGVLPDTLARFGAVSAATAREMAEGALRHSNAGLSVAVTGIAGPGGGSVEKPVGLVHLCAAHRDGRFLALERRYGALDRADIRQATVRDALALLLELAQDNRDRP